MTLGWQEDGSFRALPESPQGTLEAWTEAANMLCAGGCEAQTMALLASFASPLMALFPTDGCAVVSIWGGRQRGKSTAMTAAASVWGDPKELTVSTLGHLNGLPKLSENLANKDPGVVKSLITAASTSAHPSLWISASPTALLAVLFTEPQIAPGLELEVSVPKPLKERGDKNRIESQLRMNRGHAGSAFIARLGGQAEWAEDKLAERVALIRGETGLGEEHRLSMRAIAACWVAAMLCADRILEIDPDRIARWAMKQMAGTP